MMQLRCLVLFVLWLSGHGFVEEYPCVYLISEVTKTDTLKPEKRPETVIQSVIENNKTKATFQNAKVFDSANQQTLITLTVVIRDIESKAILTKVMLKMKDAKTGENFEPIYLPTERGFSIKVLPETTVNIYVTAPGYTDASANINDIKHDRVLAFELQKIKPSVVKIKVENVADNQPIENGTIKIQSKNTAQPQIIAWTKGGIELTYNSPDNIVLEAIAPKFSAENKELAIETDLIGKSYDITFRLTPIPTSTDIFTEKVPEKGSVIALNNIYFDQSSPVLREESFPQLNELAVFLTQNPTMKIEIRGHTDNVGDFDLNVALSRERCQSVVEYLVQKGIDATRLQSVGRGPLDAVAPNTTEENRKKNRRVVFVVL